LRVPFSGIWSIPFSSFNLSFEAISFSGIWNTATLPSVLKPQDLFVCLHLGLVPNTKPIYAALAESLHMPVSTVHRSLQRVSAAKLLDHDLQIIRPNLLELLVHGVRYVFFTQLGSQSRGVPTGAAAPGLRDRLAVSSENSPVWPHPNGRARGHILAPLHPSVSQVALENPTLHTALAAVDLIRIGTARERAVASEVLQELLG
jgi:hypothetical protein